MAFEVFKKKQHPGSHEEPIKTNQVPFNIAERAVLRLKRGGELADMRKFASNNEHARTLVHDFHYDVLERILASMARRSGVENTKLVPVKNIYLYSGNRMKEALGPLAKTGGASYDYSTNLIQINADILDSVRPENRDPLLIHILIHEQVHAVLFNEDNNNGIQYEDKQEFTRNKFHMLNEGLVETIALRVAAEYAQATGEVDSRYLERDYNKAYTTAVEFWHVFTTTLGKIWEVPQQVVEDALVRAGMRGMRLDKEPVRSAVNEVFGDSFMEELSKAKTELDIKVLLRDLNMRPVTLAQHTSDPQAAEKRARLDELFKTLLNHELGPKIYSKEN